MLRGLFWGLHDMVKLHFLDVGGPCDSSLTKPSPGLPLTSRHGLLQPLALAGR